MRPETLEDILVRMHTGQWFHWTDSKNKVYANLRLTEKMGVNGELIDNPHSLPSEKELNDRLASEQSDYDSKSYQRDRQYPELGEQLDMLWHDMTSGKGDKNGEWYKAISKVKSDHPKP
tara:strand:- start:317 stop:673 length:357 start_codon:yes stop_codon:yes gene_type:complete